MLGYVLTSSLREFTRLRRLWPWLAIVFILFGIGEVWSGVNPGVQPRDMYGQLSSILTLRMLALAAAVFSTAVLSQEVENKTIVYLLTRPIARWKLLIGRLLASVAVVYGISVLCAAAIGMSSFGVGFLGEELFHRDLIALLVGSAAYGALFLFVSLIINRAMIICLLFAFGWETALPNMPGQLYYLSVYSHLTAVAEHPSLQLGNPVAGALAGQLGTNELTPRTSWPALWLIVLVFGGLAVYWFSRFEYTPREDAG